MLTLALLLLVWIVASWWISPLLTLLSLLLYVVLFDVLDFDFPLFEIIGESVSLEV